MNAVVSDDMLKFAMTASRNELELREAALSSPKKEINKQSSSVENGDGTFSSLTFSVDAWQLYSSDSEKNYSGSTDGGDEKETENSVSASDSEDVSSDECDEASAADTGDSKDPSHSKHKCEGYEVLEDEEKQNVELGSSCHITHLPIEIMRHIFSYLWTRDKLSASLVCRTWLSAMDDSRLMSGICLCLNRVDVTVLNDRKMNEEDSYFSRKFSAFEFNQITFSLAVLDFLEKYGKKIKILLLRNCEMDKDLAQCNIVTNYCQSLEVLKFVDCAIDIFHMLPCLKKLVIESQREVVNDHFIVNLCKATPQLEILNLSLEQTVHLCDVAVENVYSVSFSEPSKTTLTLPVLLDFIKCHAKTLEEINIRRQFADYEKILYNAILKLKDLKLRLLYLDGIMLHDNSPSSVSDILKKFPAIKDLSLDIFGVNDDYVNPACSILPNLHSLCLYNARDITNLKNVFKLKGLQELVLELEIKNEVFVEALPHFQMNRLTHLDLIYVDIYPETLRDLLGRLKGLNWLRLLKVRGSTNETIRFISEHLVHLRTLYIDDKRITGRAVFNKRNPRQCLSNIKGLRELTLLGPKVSAKALLKAVKFLELRSLNIWELEKFPPNFEEEIRKANPSLHELDYF